MRFREIKREGRDVGRERDAVQDIMHIIKGSNKPKYTYDEAIEYNKRVAGNIARYEALISKEKQDNANKAIKSINNVLTGPRKALGLPETGTIPKQYPSLIGQKTNAKPDMSGSQANQFTGKARTGLGKDNTYTNYGLEGMTAAKDAVLKNKQLKKNLAIGAGVAGTAIGVGLGAKYLYDRKHKEEKVAYYKEAGVKDMWNNYKDTVSGQKASDAWKVYYNNSGSEVANKDFEKYYGLLGEKKKARVAAGIAGAATLAGSTALGIHAYKKHKEKAEKVAYYKEAGVKDAVNTFKRNFKGENIKGFSDEIDELNTHKERAHELKGTALRNYVNYSNSVQGRFEEPEINRRLVSELNNIDDIKRWDTHLDGKLDTAQSAINTERKNQLKARGLAGGVALTGLATAGLGAKHLYNRSQKVAYYKEEIMEKVAYIRSDY